MPILRIESDDAELLHAVTVSFDLSGFSTFCRHPDTLALVARMLREVFKELAKSFAGPMGRFWEGIPDEVHPIDEPDFAKYTGDGAIMIWTSSAGKRFDDQFCTNLVLAMRHAQRRLEVCLPHWESEWRVHSLPKAVRFGIAKGVVRKLEGPSLTLLQSGHTDDFAGYCINLAVRLQDHCPEVGFIVHGPLNPKIEGMIPLVALKMKGTLEEKVWVFSEDYDRHQTIDSKKPAKFREE